MDLFGRSEIHTLALRSVFDSAGCCRARDSITLGGEKGWEGNGEAAPAGSRVEVLTAVPRNLRSPSAGAGRGAVSPARVGFSLFPACRNVARGGPFGFFRQRQTFAAHYGIKQQHECVLVPSGWLMAFIRIRINILRKHLCGTVQRMQVRNRNRFGRSVKLGLHNISTHQVTHSPACGRL